MKRTANELGLDPAEDDFRIFNDKGVEVYSYTSDEELQENNWMEVFDQQSERIVVVDRTVEQGISDGDGI
ncbi:hypothetical protein JK635_07605 [Neobacillus sp. YIM B02564]|uniref:PepSY domain-containing protein n=1 Tax=Neobacillus paridis TaxID=2803862 RepID=A0ABS1TL76_9BACI|nr:hypothetical protein [Neobacillus paridis]MBL4952074.1 hypothetical protein [Neobacillus paridis]